MAKERQPGAGSSAWAKGALVLLAGGLVAAVLNLFVEPATQPGPPPPGTPSPWSAFGPSSTALFMVLVALGVIALVLDRIAAKRRANNEWQDRSAERRRLERQSRFRQVISESADAFLVLDEDNRVVEWNDGSTHLFGWRAGEAVGRSIYDLFIPADRVAAVEQLMVEHWSDEDGADGKRINPVLMSKTGRHLHTDVTLWIDDDGEHRHMNFFVRDHTDRHEVEQRIQKALADEREAVMRLQELDRVKNDFVSTVSHELRSPLTSTLGYLELLADGDAGSLDEQQKHMVEIAARNARRLHGLIEDLLTLSRIEAGEFRVQFRPIEVKTLMAGVMRENTVKASERNITMTLGKVEAAAIAGDNKELARAVNNIVCNAIKFTPPGGTVDIDVNRDGDRLLLTVKDNGIGIPAEEQAQLFSRFYRASAAVQQQHPGAGLGLTIAKTILEHHGGTIGVVSDVTVGTTVTIELPALPLEEQDATAEVALAPTPA